MRSNRQHVDYLYVTLTDGKKLYIYFGIKKSF
jgi:hypothetical protein